MKNKWKVTVLLKGHKMEIILKGDRPIDVKRKVMRQFPEGKILGTVNYNLIRQINSEHLPLPDFLF
jgi:hypothetical protein